MAADELAGRDLDLQLLREVDAPLRLKLAATIGEKDVGSRQVPVSCRTGENSRAKGGRFNLHLDAELILPVENFHRLNGFRDRPATTNQDTVDVKGKSKVVNDIWIDLRRPWLGDGRS